MMKRNILTAVLCLVAAIALQAQVLITQSGERIDLSEKKMVKIKFDFNGNYGGDIVFEFASGETQSFNIDDLSSMGFAADYTAVEQIQLKGAAAILYDAVTQSVHVANAHEQSVIRICNAEGRLVRKANAAQLSVANLDAGLYIVSYNNVLNAKILKK